MTNVPVQELIQDLQHAQHAMNLSNKDNYEADYDPGDGSFGYYDERTYQQQSQEPVNLVNNSSLYYSGSSPINGGGSDDDTLRSGGYAIANGSGYHNHTTASKDSSNGPFHGAVSRH